MHTCCMNQIIDNKEHDMDQECITAETFQHQIKQLTSDRWAARTILITHSINEMIESLVNGTAVAVSDRFFKEKIGTVCWIIEKESRAEQIVGFMYDGMIII